MSASLRCHVPRHSFKENSPCGPTLLLECRADGGAREAGRLQSWDYLDCLQYDNLSPAKLNKIKYLRVELGSLLGVAPTGLAAHHKVAPMHLVEG